MSKICSNKRNGTVKNQNQFNKVPFGTIFLSMEETRVRNLFFISIIYYQDTVYFTLLSTSPNCTPMIFFNTLYFSRNTDSRSQGKSAVTLANTAIPSKDYYAFLSRLSASWLRIPVHIYRNLFARHRWPGVFFHLSVRLVIRNCWCWRCCGETYGFLGNGNLHF